MNRRGFISGMLAACAAAAILPGAGRTWKKTVQGIYIPNPEYVNAPYEYSFIIHSSALRAIPRRVQVDGDFPLGHDTKIYDEQGKEIYRISNFPIRFVGDPNHPETLKQVPPYILV